jgi:translation elongation factor EF-Tu-like GTPase
MVEDEELVDLVEEEVRELLTKHMILTVKRTSYPWICFEGT